MTQTLNPIDFPKHLEDDVRLLDDSERGSGRIELDAYSWLYGDSQPAEETQNILYGNRLNRCNPANLSPDEKRSKGYRDGFAGVTSSALMTNRYYDEGWQKGDADRQIAKLQAEGLAIVFGDPDLDRLLLALPTWQSKALAGETIEIRYFTAEKRYVLCASVELFDRELDF